MPDGFRCARKPRRARVRGSPSTPPRWMERCFSCGRERAVTWHAMFRESQKAGWSKAAPTCCWRIRQGCLVIGYPCHRCPIRIRASAHASESARRPACPKQSGPARSPPAAIQGAGSLGHRTAPTGRSCPRTSAHTDERLRCPRTPALPLDYLGSPEMRNGRLSPRFARMGTRRSSHAIPRLEPGRLPAVLIVMRGARELRLRPL